MGLNASLTGREISVWGDASAVRAAMRIPGARKKKGSMSWIVPLSLDAGRMLHETDANVSPELEDVLARMESLQRRVEQTKLAEIVTPKVPAPIKPEFKLYNHQNKAYVLGLALQNFAAFMDMGTGKTLTTVSIAGRRFQQGKISRLLIIAPTSVCAVWPAEFQKFAGYPSRVAVLLGERDKRLRLLHNLMHPVMRGVEEPLRVAVINYESAWRSEILAALTEFNPEMIVCDESQRIKNPTAKQSVGIRKLGRLAKYRMILTGTPIQNNTLDIWSQYDFLDPNIFACNYYSFRMRYAFLGGFSGKEYLGPKNIDELTRKAHSIAYRVTKEECLDLPEQMFEDYVVEMSEKARRLYKQVKADSVAQLEGGGSVTANMVLVRLLRLQQLTGGFLVTDDGESRQVDTAKLDALADIVESLCVDARKKLVIFARFIAELDAIRETVNSVLRKGESERIASERNLASVMIRGEIKAADRGAIVERFQTDPRCRVFIGQLDACAEGITLTAADTMVYYSVNWNLAKYQQSLARTHRIGQRNACTYLHLVVPGTIDTRIMAALKSKEELATSVVDNWHSYFD